MSLSRYIFIYALLLSSTAAPSVQCGRRASRGRPGPRRATSARQLVVAPAVRALVEPRQLGQLVVAPFVDHLAEEGVRHVVVGRQALGGDRLVRRLGREGRLAEGDGAVKEVIDWGHLLRARWDRAQRRCACGVAADVLLVRLDGLRLGEVGVRQGRLVV